jgi:hypothetical protein
MNKGMLTRRQNCRLKKMALSGWSWYGSSRIDGPAFATVKFIVSGYYSIAAVTIAGKDIDRGNFATIINK